MKECEGCRLNWLCVHKDNAKFIKDGITYICPCQTCLVKGVCNVVCDRFEDFRNQSYKFNVYKRNLECLN